MAIPSFGGTNSVPALDIGQQGTARRTAGTHKATVQVLPDSPETAVATTEVPEQNVTFADNLGITGRTITWRCTLRASSEANFNAVLGELESYKSGHNAVTGATNPAHMHRTEMVAQGRTFAAVKLTDIRVRGPRYTRGDGWVVQQMDLIFRELGDMQG